MKFSLQWKWFDLWIGAYWDQKNRVLYILPLPTIVLKFDFGTQKTKKKAFTQD